MSKKTSIVLLSIIIVLVLFFGVFSFLPTFEYGNYSVYYSPIQLIQKGTDLGDTFVGTYSVDYTDMTEEEIASYQASIKKIINNRLVSVFGYYDNKVTFDGNHMIVTIPDTTYPNGTQASTIISSVVVQGFVEFTNTDSQTYNKDNVLFNVDTVENFAKSASVSQYVQGENRYYIVNVKLSEAGKELVNQKTTPSTSSAIAYCAVDEQLSYAVYYSSATSNTMQIYTNSTASAKLLASFFNDGYIKSDIVELDTQLIESTTPVAMILGFVFLAILLAFCIVCLVRYRFFGLAVTVSFAIASVLVTIFSALAYFSILNIYALIGFILGIAVMCYLTIYEFEKIHSAINNGTKVTTAMNMAFNSSWLLLLIVNGSALVLGAILWLIPTAVTVPMGNALVYCAVMSFICTFGLNRLMAMIVKPLSIKGIDKSTDKTVAKSTSK